MLWIEYGLARALWCHTIEQIPKRTIVGNLRSEYGAVTDISDNNTTEG